MLAIYMALNLLLINTIYPQIFYEVARLFAAGILPSIPPWNELNPFDEYRFFIFSRTKLNIVKDLPLQFYRVGFTGYLVVDTSKQLMVFATAYTIFLLLVRVIYSKYKAQIKAG